MVLNKRRQIIDFIYKVVKNASEKGKRVDKKKLIAEICLNFYMSERFVKEIIKHMILAEIIKEEKGELFMSESKPENEI